MKALSYFGMLVFDLAVLSGAVYLVDQRGWSTGTIFVALIVMAGSSPTALWTASKRRAHAGQDAKVDK